MAEQINAPVFVTAPTARNGVTLIQRLLNSSREIIVFGENTILVGELPMAVAGATQTRKVCESEFDASRKKFLSGTTEYWTSNLWPSCEQFEHVVRKAFDDAVGVYEACAREHGFARWGIKNPMVRLTTIDELRSFIPGLRTVFIYRDLHDVIRSAKARNFIQDARDVTSYAARWRAHVDHVMSTASDYAADELLIIEHEQLVADPGVWISRLAEFTGIDGIDASVMDRKINTFDGYVEPVELSGMERGLIRKVLRDSAVR